jgi:hypothetical protein
MERDRRIHLDGRKDTLRWKLSWDRERLVTTLGLRPRPTADDVREQTRERVRRFRERQRK